MTISKANPIIADLNEFFELTQNKEKDRACKYDPNEKNEAYKLINQIKNIFYTNLKENSISFELIGRQYYQAHLILPFNLNDPNEVQIVSQADKPPLMKYKMLMSQIEVQSTYLFNFINNFFSGKGAQTFFEQSRSYIGGFDIENPIYRLTINYLPKVPEVSQKMSGVSDLLFQDLEQQKLTDFTIECKGSVPGEIKVHKLILALRSPFWQKMFENKMKELTEQKASIFYSSTVVRAALYSLYTGSCYLERPEHQDCDPVEMLDLAESWGVEPLKNMVINQIITKSSIDQKDEVRKLAKKYNIEPLLKAAQFYDGFSGS